MSKNAVGVLGSDGERSLRDRQLQSEFGGCSGKGVRGVKEGFMLEPRSQKDMAMLAKFNTCCNNPVKGGESESYEDPYNSSPVMYVPLR